MTDILVGWAIISVRLKIESKISTAYLLDFVIDPLPHHGYPIFGNVRELAVIQVPISYVPSLGLPIGIGAHVAIVGHSFLVDISSGRSVKPRDSLRQVGKVTSKW